MRTSVAVLHGSRRAEDWDTGRVAARALSDRRRMRILLTCARYLRRYAPLVL